jgi:hypothetical protein
MPVKQFKGVKEIIDIGTEGEEIDEEKYEKGEAHTIADEEREFNFFNGLRELKSDFLQTSQGALPSTEYFVAYHREEDHSCCHNNHRWRKKTTHLITGKGFSESTERTGMYSDKNTKDSKKDDQGNNSDKV